MDIKNIVAGKRYINKSGEEKTQWINVGKLFIKDDGKMTVKMNEYINLSAFRNDKGEVWFNVFEEKPSENGKPAQEQKPNQVVEDGKMYAEKFRKMAELKAAEEKAKQQPSDEEWFKEHQHIVDALVD